MHQMPDTPATCDRALRDALPAAVDALVARYAPLTGHGTALRALPPQGDRPDAAARLALGTLWTAIRDALAPIEAERDARVAAQVRVAVEAHYAAGGGDGYIHLCTESMPGWADTPREAAEHEAAHAEGVATWEAHDALYTLAQRVNALTSYPGEQVYGIVCGTLCWDVRAEAWVPTPPVEG